MRAVAPQQISLEGRISIDNSNAMRNRLRKALKLKPKEIDVDLSRVTAIDISGLATLLGATRIAGDQGPAAENRRDSRAGLGLKKSAFCHNCSG